MAKDYGEEKRMKILVVEPGKGPCVREIEHGLKAMQPSGAVPEHQRRPVDSAWINQIPNPCTNRAYPSGTRIMYFKRVSFRDLACASLETDLFEKCSSFFCRSI